MRERRHAGNEMDLKVRICREMHMSYNGRKGAFFCYPSPALWARTFAVYGECSRQMERAGWVRTKLSNEARIMVVGSIKFNRRTFSPVPHAYNYRRQQVFGLYLAGSANLASAPTVEARYLLQPTSCCESVTAGQDSAVVATAALSVNKQGPRMMSRATIGLPRWL